MGAGSIWRYSDFFYNELLNIKDKDLIWEISTHLELL
jgi:hypothetical protein